MTLNELRSALQAILALEEAPGTDWVEVTRQCNRTLSEVRSSPAPDYTDEFVYAYLEDPPLRKDDPDYALIQRERLRNWLEGSEIISR